jgi:diguanylate cyclase (GGDEF)-like protein/PAS domain S-box-containing protein
MLPDRDEAWTIGTVASREFDAAFVPVGERHLNAGMVREPVWLRFTVQAGPALRPDKPEAWLLTLSRPFIDSATLFTREGGSWRQTDLANAGRSGTLSGDLTVALPFDFEQPRTFFLRVRHDGGLYLPLRLEAPSAHERRARVAMLWFGVFYGILLTMAVYNATMWIWLGDRTYLWYVLFVVSMGAFFLAANGLVPIPAMGFGQLALKRGTLLALSAAALWGGLFTRSFLSTASMSPNADRLLKVFIFVAASVTILCPFAPVPVTGRLLSGLGMFVPLIVVGLGAHLLRRGYAPARFFLVGWTVFAFGTVAFVFVHSGVVPYAPWLYHAFQFGTGLQVALFSFALADRIATMRREHAETRASLEQAQRENALQSLVLENSGLGIAFVKDGSFEWANQRVAEMLDRPIDDLRNQPVRLMYPDEDAYTSVNRRMTDAFARGDSFAAECQLGRSNGELFWARMVGRPVAPERPAAGSVWVLEDISARKEAESMLQRQMDFENMVADLAQGFLMAPLDALESSLLDALKRVARFLGDVQTAYLGHFDAAGEVRDCLAVPCGGGESLALPTEGLGGLLRPVRDEQCVVVEQLSELDEEERSPAMEATGTATVMWAPLIGESGAFGFMGFGTPDPRHEWPERDIRLVEAVASPFASAVQRLRSETALSQSEAKYRRLVENLEDEYFFFSYNREGVTTFVSRSIANVLGYEPAEFLTEWTRFMTDNPVNEEARRHADQSLLGVQQPVYYCELLHKNGSRRWIEITEVPLTGSGGAVEAVEGMAHDITERKNLVEELRRLATTDPLTGAFNRRHFMETANDEFRRGERYDRPLAVLMLDIDYFKRVNDTYGHAVGDAVLKQVTSVCQETLREADVFGRLGGEEFAALLPETSVGAACEAAERVRARLGGAAVPTEEGDVAITVSIGVASRLPDDTSAEQMLQRADAALYAAKNAGRNRVVTEKVKV